MEKKTQRIIDFHNHVFPEKVAEKAVAATGAYYGIPMGRSGVPEDLIASGAEAGISEFLICSTATRPGQVRSVNRFIAGACAAHGEFTGFGTLHPEQPDIGDELCEIERLGLKGVKLHPDFQGFPIDGREAMAVYERLEGRLPLLIHMGDQKSDFSRPGRLANVVRAFPKLTVIGAHFGGYSVWDEAKRELAGLGIYVDTSSSLALLTPDRARELIGAYGPERCLFGTDYPMWEHKAELALFDSLGLDGAQRERILWKNAAELLGI